MNDHYGNLFLLTNCSGQWTVVRGTNNGADWNIVDSGPGSGIPYQLLLDQNDFIYVLGQAGVNSFILRRSENHGLAWTNIYNPQEYWTLPLHPHGSLFAISQTAGIYKSSNQGTSWTSEANYNNSNSFAMFFVDWLSTGSLSVFLNYFQQGNYYSATYTGTNLGTTWPGSSGISPYPNHFVGNVYNQNSQIAVTGATTAVFAQNPQVASGTTPAYLYYTSDTVRWTASFSPPGLLSNNYVDYVIQGWNGNTFAILDTPVSVGGMNTNTIYSRSGGETWDGIPYGTFQAGWTKTGIPLTDSTGNIFILQTNSGGNQWQLNELPYGPSGLRFVPMNSCRIVSNAHMPAQSYYNLTPYNECNIPRTAQAYSMNVTVTPNSGNYGYLSWFPTTGPEPTLPC